MASHGHNDSLSGLQSCQSLALTPGCHHYKRRKDVAWDIQKYWDQRYKIFSRYDEGVVMTDDAWFGVTPEAVALQIAQDLSRQVPSSNRILIDMFAGAGGNTIAFALSGRWENIIAIEKDPSALACAQNNATIYGVCDEITWILGDSFSYLNDHTSTIDIASTTVFASPPWGGPGYISDTVFDLDRMLPYTLHQIHHATRTMYTALFLPRTSNLRQIARLAPTGRKISVIQYCMEGASKGLVTYIPACLAE